MRLPRVNARWAILLALVLVVVAAPVALAWPRGLVTLTSPGTGPPTTGFSVAESGTPTTPPAQPARPEPSPSTEPPARRAFTVIGAGDVLLHSGLWRQGARDAAAQGERGYEFGPLLASVAPAVSAADLAICHLETPVGRPAGPFSSYPIFEVPPQIAPALARTGYDTCSTASNHSLDRGAAGITRTLDVLDQAGLRHTGTARSAAESGRTTLLEVRGVRVAHLSYTFSFNGLTRPRGREWLANYLDPQTVLTHARRAKRAGAEVVIVSLHWGTEYAHRPNRHQTSVARRLLASPDVDLLLGHHAHVVQPLERIGDKWVAYGMGNQLAYQHFSPDTRDGIMPRFTFTEVRPGLFRVTKAEVLATHMWLDGRPIRLYDVAAALADPRLPGAVRASCRASLRRTAAILGDLGAFDDGLELVGVTRR